MVSRIKTINDIEWHYPELELLETNISLAKRLPFKLPNKFLELLKISDGGELYYQFTYYSESFKDNMQGGISLIYGLANGNSYTSNSNYDPFAPEGSIDSKEFFVTYNNIIDRYNNPPACFPENLVAFGTNGGGDMICFDYRNDPKTDNPPVVYWDHGAYIGEDVSFLTNNFEEFIQMLREPEPFEEFLKKISKKEE